MHQETSAIIGQASFQDNAYFASGHHPFVLYCLIVNSDSAGVDRIQPLPCGQHQERFLAYFARMRLFFALCSSSQRPSSSISDAIFVPDAADVQMDGVAATVTGLPASAGRTSSVGHT